MEAKRFTGEEIRQKSEEIKDWKHQITEIPGRLQNKSIDMLFKMFPFSNYQQTRKFADQVAAIAERLEHYPTVTFAGNYATVVTCTMNIEGLTEKDFVLAKQIDEINTP